MRKLSFSQHGMLADLAAGKPYDYSYPNRYQWLSGTVHALLRKGLIEPPGYKHGYKLTQLGKYYAAKYVKPSVYHKGNKHPIAKNWTSHKLVF